MEAIFNCPHPIPLPKGERVRSSDEASSHQSLVKPGIVGPSLVPDCRGIVWLSGVRRSQGGDSSRAKAKCPREKLEVSSRFVSSRAESKLERDSSAPPLVLPVSLVVCFQRRRVK